MTSGGKRFQIRAAATPDATVTDGDATRWWNVQLDR